MALDIRDNATLLDAVRLRSSNQYQQMVPEADAVGLERVADVLESNQTLFNEFHENAINLIGTQIVREYDFNNPLAVFKRENLRMGQMIEELAVSLIAANGYNMKDNNLFKRNPAEVYAKIHKLNRKARYDLTINPTLVAQALRTEDGLAQLIARELQMPGISDEADEFAVMKQLIAFAFARDEIFKVNTPFATPGQPTADELKTLSIEIRSYAESLSFLTTLYSAEGVPTVSRRENLVLIVTPRVKANLDVQVLADAFHTNRADFASRMVTVDEIPVAGAYAMLVDVNWFVCADYVKEMNSFFNAKSLETNFYLHHWGLYATSPYVNAIIFGEFPTDSVPVITIALDSIEATVVDEDGDAVTTFSYGDDLRIDVKTEADITPVNPNGVFVAPKGWEAEITIADSAGVAKDKTLKTSYTVNGDLRVQEGLVAGDKITIKVTSTYEDPSGIITDEDWVRPTDTVVLTVA